MNASSRLAALLGPAPQPPSPVDWADVERVTGFAAPLDYREWADVCPAVTIDDFLTVFRPGTYGADLLAPDALLQPLRELRTDVPQDVPFPLHPEPGGLYPWGITVNSHWLYWLPGGPRPSAPAAIVVIHRSGQWQWPGTMSGFLVATLTGEARCPLFPDHFPAPELTVTWEHGPPSLQP